MCANDYAMNYMYSYHIHVACFYLKFEYEEINARYAMSTEIADYCM